MILSTRSTYGVRAMLALAMHTSSKPLMVREIAEQYHLPATYLEQLMGLLRKAKLVTAIRGAHGGYLLARSPSEISLIEIIEVLEGTLTLTDCPTSTGCCGQPDTCALQEIWYEATNALHGVLQSVSLASLVERQREKTTSTLLMYHI